MGVSGVSESQTVNCTIANTNTNTASQKYSFVLKSVALVIVDDTDVGNTKKNTTRKSSGNIKVDKEGYKF